jgi:hypothetical protein
VLSLTSSRRRRVGRQERESGIYTVTGEPFVWALSIWPIVAFFVVVNAVWAAVIIVRRRWRDARVWFITPLIWLVAILIDFSHH